ncbi:STM3941 family protein [Kitasatospora sp. NPDC093550]|uniref:STM3941 family protein n=1 Tax=Kitasatospora sp. NPDC093550 TaxID=3364089 RepID=UPI00381FBF97
MTDQTSAVPPTVYRSSPLRMVLVLLGSVAFVAMGASLLSGEQSVKNRLSGGLAIVFFGLCAVVCVKRLVRGRPELVLDAAGLDHVQLGRIPWQEIAAVRIRVITVRGATQRVIELVLADPARYLAGAPRYVRATAAANRSMGYGPANISANTLRVGPEAVIAAMRHHHPALVVAD